MVLKNTSLDAYLVQVRQKHSRVLNGGLELGKFDGSSSFIKVLSSLVKKVNAYKNITEIQRSLKISNIKNSGSYLSGVLHVGEYGTASEIIDVTNGSVTHKKQKHHADIAPYYFLYILPDHNNKGLLCVQRSGVHGVKGIIELLINGLFSAQFPDHVIDIMNVAPSALMEEFVEKGNVCSVTVQNHVIPSDIADQFIGKSQKYDGTVEFTIKPKDRNFFKKSGLVAYLNGTKKITDVFDLENFEFDTVKAKIDVGGKVRAVNLTNPSRFNASFDLTDSLDEGSDGLPTLTSLELEFRNIARDLAKRAGITP